MTRHAMVCLGLVLCSFATIGAPAVQEAVDGYRLTVPDGGWYEIAGVCDAGSYQISCWKPNGTPDPKLTELLKAYYLVNSQARLEIRYKHRSLMLVTRSFFETGPGHAGLSVSSVRLNPGNDLNSQNFIGNMDQNEPMTAFYWFYPEADQTFVDISTTLNSNIESVKMPLKVGAEVKMQGGILSLLSIGKAADTKNLQNNGGYGPPPPGPRWTAGYKLTPEGPDPIQSIYVYAYDQNGQPITQVDGKGNPVSRTPGPRFNDGFQSNYPIAAIAGADVITLRVNPEKVGYLIIGGTTRKAISFKHIALASK